MADQKALRETYINHLDRILHLHDQLDGKLVLLDAASKSATAKLGEAAATLEGRLKATNISSTASSVASIVGVIMLFTPAAPFGAVLAGVGAAGSIGTAAVQNFFFEPNAAQVFADATNNYTSSSKGLGGLFSDIELERQALIYTLTQFLAALEQTPDHGVNNRPEEHSGPDVQRPDWNHIQNGFSKIALKGAGVGGTLGVKRAIQFGETLLAGKASSELLVKAFPMLGKFMGKVLPVVSILIDAQSIFSTWTGNNETLEKAKKLQKDILDNFAAFRDTVRRYLETLEELVGGKDLQDKLRKLIRLRDSPPNPPGGWPSDSDIACKMLALMEAMLDVSFILFTSLQGDDHEDAAENRYITELMPEADVEKIGQMSLCAPVIDSVYELFPDIETPLNDQQSSDDPGQKSVARLGMMAGIKNFRIKCRWVKFGYKLVYNVNGSSNDDRVPSWVKFWIWFRVAANKLGCWNSKCHIHVENTEPHRDRIVGGHLELERYPTVGWFIVPICHAHNSPRAKKYDRGGQVMLTHKGTMAVRIPKL